MVEAVQDQWAIAGALVVAVTALLVWLAVRR
jgi:hypothetical protein